MTIQLLLMLGIMGTSSIGTDADAQYVRPELLVEPMTLAEADASERFVVLDARSQAEYDAGHVPQARRVDHEAWKKAFGEQRETKSWSQAIARLGIDSNSKVVVYDDKGTKDAARIWWILKYWGVKDSRLLNGGWTGWKSSGLPTTKAAPSETPPTDFQAVPHANRLATMSQILELLPADGIQIIDARSEDEFCGIEMRDNKKGGAIPGAKHLEWSELIDQETQRFKSPAELQRLFAEAGIELNRPSASHCNGGGRAAVMAFGLELMGAKDIRNYYRGWGEWGNADNTPVMVPTKEEQKPQ